MCLLVNKEKHHKEYNKHYYIPLIASKDILVWKIIYRGDVSIFQNYSYSPNKLYETCMGKMYIINAGFHAYRSRKIARCAMSAFRRAFSHCKIVKFIIPKGAEYFFGYSGDIVSNKIISGDLKHCR